MRVLLINPSTLDLLPNKEYIPPSSLLYLAGILQRDGIEVKIYNHLEQPIAVYRVSDAICSCVYDEIHNSDKPTCSKTPR